MRHLQLKYFLEAVNCTNLHNDEPCNECESCRDILEDKTMDVVEIDAASNNSVDDIRELRENVKYSPAKSKYKVYIIDEVHMLSQGAFNALLKTLEEATIIRNIYTCDYKNHIKYLQQYYLDVKDLTLKELQ